MLFLNSVGRKLKSNFNNNARESVLGMLVCTENLDNHNPSCPRHDFTERRRGALQ